MDYLQRRGVSTAWLYAGARWTWVSQNSQWHRF